MQGPSVPECPPFDTKYFLTTSKSDGIRRVSLQFDCVGAGVFGSANYAHCLIEILIVVGRKLRHDVSGIARPDLVIANAYLHFAASRYGLKSPIAAPSNIPCVHREE